MIRLNTERLQHELFRNNMKQRDLANAIGVTEVSISRYFNGSRMPKGSILIEMARVLRTTPEYLMGTEGLEHPDEAFNKAKVAIETYGEQWLHCQKKELIDLLVDACADNFME